MKYIYRIILKWLKQKVDKLYKKEYNVTQETLVREMFPWIYNVWEYKFLNNYIASHCSINEITDLIKVIHSFYWWEINQLIASWKIESINDYRWLLIFANNLKDFYDIYVQNLKDNTL